MGEKNSLESGEPRFARWLHRYGQFGPLFLTPLILIGSACFAVRAYNQQQNYFTNQLNELRDQNAKQQKNFENQAKTLADSVNAAALTTLYSQGNDVTKVQLENIDLEIFFDKYARNREGLTEKDVEERYENADPKTRNRIYNICVLTADFMEETYARRYLHPAEDWDAWWNSLCDDYDESLALRDYFAVRGPRWYSVHEKLEPISKDGAIDWEKTKAKRAMEYRTQRFQNQSASVPSEPRK